ncbi:MAG: hypothetical protein AAGJ18_00050 [Bacteroidota bacterium]
MTFKVNKQTTSWQWLMLLFVGFLAIAITSCGDDAIEEMEEMQEEQVVPDPEVESAVLQITSVRNPGGDAVIYATVTPEVAENFDISQAVELGINVAIETFEDDMFVINASSSTITKYSVDRTTLDLQVEGILSFASTGITSTRTLVFASATRAFISDLLEGSILEFNPETMEIANTFDVSVPVTDVPENLNLFIFQGYLTNGGKVVWPIDYNAGPACCDDPVPLEVMPSIAVFDPATNQLTYKSDARLPLGNRSFQGGDGSVYLTSASWMGFFQNYFGSVPDAGFHIVRLDDNGDFETDYGFAAEGLIDVDYGGDINAVQGDEALIRYNDIEAWPESYEQRWSWWGDPAFSFDAVVNLSDNTFRMFDGFDEYGLGVGNIGSIDGKNYYAAYTAVTVGWEEGEQPFEVELIRQESFDNFTTVQTGFPQNAGISLITTLW